MLPQKTLKNIILADDDEDDCLFFKDALDELSLNTSFTALHNGEQLMKYLETVFINLPDVLFLDLNMPRKNGLDCLIEIKKHPLLQKLPVIIYSTSYDIKTANLLYDEGAHYYICKPINYEELKTLVYKAITLLEKKHSPISRENFFINNIKSA